jgi:hypothetical protein
MVGRIVESLPLRHEDGEPTTRPSLLASDSANVDQQVSLK